jgi:hypothetical protein
MFLRYDTVDETDTRNAMNTLSSFISSVDRCVDRDEKEATK